MKNFFKNRTLKKLTSDQDKVSFKGLDESKLAFILFSNKMMHKPDDVIQLEERLKQLGIETISLGYIQSKIKKGTAIPEGYLFKNQLNWLGIPKLDFLRDLNSKKFDLLFSFDNEIKSPNSFILLAVTAGLKVGFSHNESDFDLVIEKKSKGDENWLGTLEHYLKNIRKT